MARRAGGKKRLALVNDDNPKHPHTCEEEGEGQRDARTSKEVEMCSRSSSSFSGDCKRLWEGHRHGAAVSLLLSCSAASPRRALGKKFLSRDRSFLERIMEWMHSKLFFLICRTGRTCGNLHTHVNRGDRASRQQTKPGSADEQRASVALFQTTTVPKWSGKTRREGATHIYELGRESNDHEHLSGRKRRRNDIGR